MTGAPLIPFLPSPAMPATIAGQAAASAGRSSAAALTGASAKPAAFSNLLDQLTGANAGQPQPAGGTLDEEPAPALARPRPNRDTSAMLETKASLAQVLTHPAQGKTSSSKTAGAKQTKSSSDRKTATLRETIAAPAPISTPPTPTSPLQFAMPAGTPPAAPETPHESSLPGASAEARGAGRVAGPSRRVAAAADSDPTSSTERAATPDASPAAAREEPDNLPSSPRVDAARSSGSTAPVVFEMRLTPPSAPAEAPEAESISKGGEPAAQPTLATQTAVTASNEHRTGGEANGQAGGQSNSEPERALPVPANRLPGPKEQSGDDRPLAQTERARTRASTPAEPAPPDPVRQQDGAPATISDNVSHAAASSTPNPAALVADPQAAPASVAPSASPTPSASPQAHQASEPPDPGPAPAGAPANDIRLQVPTAAGNVDVRVVDKGGDVHVAVRTADSHLAGNLREGLPVLSAKLEESGFRSDAWRPAASAERRAETPAPGRALSSDAQSSDLNRGKQQQQQQQQRPQQQNSGPAGRQSNKSERNDFAWLFTSIR